MAKPWAEKFQKPSEPVIEVLDKNYAGHVPGDVMLISTPAEIDSEIRKLPKGTAEDLTWLRELLAKKHQADFTCPLTTGIFTRIAAEKSIEENSGLAFWRVVDPKSPLANKLSYGPDYILKMRSAEAK